MIRTVIRGLWTSTSLRIAAGYSVSGAAFAGAMLLLARGLPKPEYGLLGLVVAILNLTSRTAPMGADGIVNRHRMDPGPRFLGRVLLIAAAFGAVVTAFSQLIYDLDATTLGLIFAGTVVGAASFVASSQFQAEEKFGVSLLLNQGSNFVLLAAALVVLLAGAQTAFVPLVFFVGGFALTAVVGWGALLASRGTHPEPGEEYNWAEAVSYWGVAGGALFLHHLDRLLTPELLSFEALATFNVLAAIVGAPFHMLELGVGYTLLPRLRRAVTPSERRRLILREGLVTSAAYLGMAMLLLIATPWIVRLFVGDKYVLSTGLIVAALYLGLLRLSSGYAKTIVKSIGTTADLIKLNVFSWVSIVLAGGGAAVGAAWGLEGLLYGLGVGWIGHSAAGFGLGLRHLREPRNVEAIGR
jgi:O-antigen/teichoic acid export membrane protein